MEYISHCRSNEKKARRSKNLSLDITLGKKGVDVTGFMVQYSEKVHLSNDAHCYNNGGELLHL